jgi:D-sedoheptulose 7-phosphate isomerase
MRTQRPAPPSKSGRAGRLGQPDISTSGASPNILAAASTARALGMRTVALVGRPGSPLEPDSDITIVTPAGRYSDRVQELHIKVIHVLIELVEWELFPERRG